MAELRGNRAEETEEKPRQLKCCRAGVRTGKREALERKALEPFRSRVLSRKDGHTLLRKRPPVWRKDIQSAQWNGSHCAAVPFQQLCRRKE